MKKICFVCGEEYTPTCGKRQKYCSRTCMGKAMNMRQCGENNPRWEGGKLELTCQNPECGKMFTTWIKDQKYCSSTCMGEALSGENHYNWKEKIELICQNTNCNKIFTLPPSRLRLEGHRGKYCSRACMGEAQRGENNSCWKGGITPETVLIRNGSDTRKWRKSVFKRDNYTCQKCNDRQGGNLCAHHIQNFAQYPELRFDVDNGITLCEDCHDEFHKLYGKSNNDQNEIDTFLYWNLGDNKIMKINKEVN